MKKLIYFFLPFCLWLLSISSPAQYAKIIRDTDCGLYKGETLMVSDSLYNKEGKSATPKYGKIRVLGFTEAYDVNAPKNKTSNFQKDSLYDILQDAADLKSVYFKGDDGEDRFDVSGLKIEKVQTGYIADSSQLCYKAYLPNDTCWFVSTKDAEKYAGHVSVDKTKDVLDKSYREENDVYIVCEYNGRVVIEGIAKPFIIKAGEETKLADVSGKKMRFIFDDGLSFVIPFKEFKLKGEPTTQEILIRVLIVVLVLLIICLICKYRKKMFNWLKKIRYKESNPFEQSEAGKLLLDQITKIIDEKIVSLYRDVEAIKTDLINLDDNVKQTLELLGKPSSYEKPKKDIDIEDLKILIGESVIAQSINEIRGFINNDVKPVLTSFVGNKEKPLSLNQLKQNFDIEGLKAFIENEIEAKTNVVTQLIECVSKRRSDEEKHELEQKRNELINVNNKLKQDIKDLQAQVPNSSDFIKNGVKVEGCDSFIGFSVDFLSTCQKAEEGIYFRMKTMPVDEKVKAGPILSEYYQTRPTLMIEKWKEILATLKMCGHVPDAFGKAKKSEEREKYMHECFFIEIIRPYASALLICLERFRTGKYINLKLDDAFVIALGNNIEAIMQVCRINEIEVIYERLFEELNLDGEQYKNYEIIHQKPDDKLSNWLDAKALKKNLLLSVSEYAVNSITTKWGDSRPEKTKCTVLDV